MIKLNAGNLWTDEYLDKVIALNELHARDNIRVSSIFGSISGLTPTARSEDRIPKRDWAFIEKYVARAQANNISIRYTLNPSCVGSMQEFYAEWRKHLKNDLAGLHSVGINDWVITSALLIEQIHELYPEDYIEVSTIAEVDSAKAAQRFLDLGAESVCIATSANRDLDKISEVMSTGITVSILANEACLYQCAYRRDCYNLSSHNSERGDELFNSYPFNRCSAIRAEDPSEWLRSRMVLPQWMKKYEASTGVDHFKVAFRTHPYEVAIPILEAYMNQQFNGNYMDLWPTIKKLGNTDDPADKLSISCEILDENKFIEHFFRGKCHSDCGGTDCSYCEVIKEAASSEK